ALRPCRQAWRHRAEFTWYDRCGLSRRDQRAPDQPWRRTVSDPARRTHRADGDRSRGAGATGCGRAAFGHRTRQRRLRFDRAIDHPFKYGLISPIKSASQNFFPAFFAERFTFTVWTLLAESPLGLFWFL